MGRKRIAGLTVAHGGSVFLLLTELGFNGLEVAFSHYNDTRSDFGFGGVVPRAFEPWDDTPCHPAEENWSSKQVQAPL